ncbi:hypothetical protein [Paracoccus pacificus]|uniref:Uncharacterized protein n=1 Tax=Paracoccus pacificus TaxID=1463598 RepID=A0ABW4R6N7_9RHOB
MIGERAYGGRRHWLQALALSLMVHAAAASTLVDWKLPRAAPPPVPDVPEIQIIPIGPDAELPGPEVVAPEAVEVATLTPVTPAPPGAQNPTETGIAPAPQDEMLAPVNLPSETPVLQPQQPGALTSAAAPQTLGPVPADQTVIAALPPDADRGAVPDISAPPDGGPISDLVSGIRENLGDACLLAVPRQQPDGNLALTVMAADDRSISGFIDTITAKTTTPMTPTPVLLDRRQCPAITWLRASPRYPATGLVVTLASRELASGDHVQGRIDGGDTGQTVTLLMIDDDGVVQDARRFMLDAEGATRFDAKVTRSGAARDTGILLLALATPAVPAAVETQAGRTAAEFFAALEADAAPGTPAGAAVFTLR